jgi:hypothetical protein
MAGLGLVRRSNNSCCSRKPKSSDLLLHYSVAAAEVLHNLNRFNPPRPSEPVLAPSGPPTTVGILGQPQLPMSFLLLKQVLEKRNWGDWQAMWMKIMM